MKWATTYLFAILVLLVPDLYGQTTPTLQALRLSGQVGDVYSHARLDGATFFATVGKQRKKLGSSDQEGSFNLEYPREATSLLVEKKGYRALVIMTEISGEHVETTPYYFRLPLIPLDRQAHDKPYLQSQQEDYVLEAQASTKQSLSRIFRVINALSHEPILEAKICLDYTKVEKKECHTLTRDSSTYKVTFLEADIVSVVVESEGYQTYRGNLILEKLDGSTSAYEINLTPEITLLTMHISNYPADMNCRLIADDGDTTYLSRGAGTSYYTFGKSGDYSLSISNEQGILLHSEKISLKKGLNIRTIKIAESFKTTAKPVRTRAEIQARLPVINATPLADTTRHITLYFTQSDYELLPEACQLLDQLVMLLRHKPERRVMIEGHSDNVGDPYRNETLSEYRARKTLKYLEERGIGSERMDWRGMGSRKPLARNDTEENKKKNRRVDILIIP